MYFFLTDKNVSNDKIQNHSSNVKFYIDYHKLTFKIHIKFIKAFRLNESFLVNNNCFATQTVSGFCVIISVILIKNN